MGNTTSYVFDAMHRVTTETSPAGARSYTYDADGNVLSITDRNGRVRQFTYDALHRRLTEQWVGAGARTITFSYDTDGLMTSASDPDSSYAFTYDALHRLTQMAIGATLAAPAIVLDHTYDVDGNRTSTGFSGDFFNAYQYDALHRRTQITQVGTAAPAGVPLAAKQVDFVYDADSRLTSMARLVSGTLATSAVYTYDAMHRMTGESHTTAAGYGAAFSNTYDLDGQITQATSPDGTSTYSYDAIHELVGAAHSFQAGEGYSYDANGNRTGAGYAVGSDNRLLSDAAYTYDYDAEGNRIRRTDPVSGEVTEYSWDHRNRLTHVVTKDNAGMIMSDASYSYDVFDLRVAKVVDAGGAVRFAVFQHAVQDGGQLVRRGGDCLGHAKLRAQATQECAERTLRVH